MDSETRRRRLEALAAEPDPLRKKLIAVGLLGDALAADGIVPVIVGGTALAVYTGGGYETKDIDLALPIAPEVDAAFDDLGFTKRGRYWMRSDLDLLIEAPAPAALPGETAPRTELAVDDLRVIVLGLEDLMLDRLRAGVHWASAEDRRWLDRLAQLWKDKLDWNYLGSKAVGAEAEALTELKRKVER